jgi:hypothetical protein
MPVACLGIGLFAWERWHLLGVMERIVLTLAFLVPSLASLGVWWMPPILLAALWIQVGQERRKRAAGSTNPQPLA